MNQTPPVHRWPFTSLWCHTRTNVFVVPHTDGQTSLWCHTWTDVFVVPHADRHHSYKWLTDRWAWFTRLVVSYLTDYQVPVRGSAAWLGPVTYMLCRFNQCETGCPLKQVSVVCCGLRAWFPPVSQYMSCCLLSTHFQSNTMHLCDSVGIKSRSATPTKTCLVSSYADKHKHTLCDVILFFVCVLISHFYILNRCFMSKEDFKGPCVPSGHHNYLTQLSRLVICINCISYLYHINSNGLTN